MDRLAWLGEQKRSAKLRLAAAIATHDGTAAEQAMQEVDEWQEKISQELSVLESQDRN